MQNFGKYCISLLFLLGIGFCIYFISSGELTTRESALLSMLLTILSIIATWIVTHIYTQSQHKRAIEDVQEAHRTNLRTYALKAAEKVNNLSKQLNQLSSYLGESLEYDDNDNVRDNFLISQERIESSIHMINTLKSVNDTALSDWEGVIGDELDEQREQQAETEQAFDRIVERFQLLSDAQLDTQRYTQDSTEALSKELISIKKDIRSMAATLGVTPMRINKTIQKKPPKIEVNSLCPSCNQAIKYRQRTNINSVKTFTCQNCGAQLISTYDPTKEFTIQKRVIAKELIECPTCKNNISFDLDTLPDSFITVLCDKCNNQLDIIRNKNGLIDYNANTVTDAIVELVKNALPPQPWPTGTTSDIAVKLGIPHAVVSGAINKLIRKGVFKVQYYGKLYTPLSKKLKDKTSDIRDEDKRTLDSP